MRRAAAALLLLAAALPASAHELQHEAEHGDAVSVRFHYADGAPFSYETCEVYRPGEETPFQVGRTDALGRIAFVPDREGEWRVRVFSEDGHGADLRVPAGPLREPSAPSPARASRSSRLLFGLGLILGVYGTIALIQTRKKK